MKHLQRFCEKLDELGVFFTQLQDFVEDMDQSRVDPFSTITKTTKSLGYMAKKEESGAARVRKEKVKERKLQVRAGFFFSYSPSFSRTRNHYCSALN